MTQSALLESTEMLDFQGEAITSLLESKGWMTLSKYDRIGAAYHFGVFDHPDDFYAAHGANLSGIKKMLYRYFFQHLMNRNVKRIRACKK